MSNQFEIEIKSLLGSQENASLLKDKIREKGGTLNAKNNQLNHYFLVDDVSRFKDKIRPHISESSQDSFDKILDEGRNFSVRTRDTDGKVRIVVKASIGDDTSANGISRLEFESEMKMSLDNLDKLLLDAGLSYQAKWSRLREEYIWRDIHICLDKNAGYGYLAEFEKVVSDVGVADSTKRELLRTMQDFGVEELPQDRLERMFAYYNSNWKDYYGTEKIFNIE